MSDIDYACGIDCPDNYDDEQMLMNIVVDDDCELCYLDTYLNESFKGRGARGGVVDYGVRNLGTGPVGRNSGGGSVGDRASQGRSGSDHAGGNFDDKKFKVPH